MHPRRNLEEFAPVSARFVRFTILKTTGSQPCLDELEVCGPDASAKNVALAENGTIARARARCRSMASTRCGMGTTAFTGMVIAGFPIPKAAAGRSSNWPRRCVSTASYGVATARGNLSTGSRRSIAWKWRWNPARGSSCRPHGKGAQAPPSVQER